MFLIRCLALIIHQSGLCQPTTLRNSCAAPESKSRPARSSSSGCVALDKIFSEKKSGATALWDGCALAVTKVSNGQHAKKIVLVFSDGVDTLSDISLSTVQNQLRKTDVRLYAINIGETGEGTIGEAYIEGAKNLRKLASTSHGEVFKLKKKSDLISVFENIAATLRQ
ncbi:MAG: VWA domain-containing protein [Acidobacteria bacterium]|nr:VWA domain-containing protein [Acidobacteriota bacterium]